MIQIIQFGSYCLLTSSNSRCKPYWEKIVHFLMHHMIQLHIVWYTVYHMIFFLHQLSSLILNLQNLSSLKKNILCLLNPIAGKIKGIFWVPCKKKHIKRGYSSFYCRICFTFFFFAAVRLLLSLLALEVLPLNAVQQLLTKFILIFFFCKFVAALPPPLPPFSSSAAASVDLILLLLLLFVLLLFYFFPYPFADVLILLLLLMFFFSFFLLLLLLFLFYCCCCCFLFFFFFCCCSSYSWIVDSKMLTTRSDCSLFYICYLYWYTMYYKCMDSEYLHLSPF